MKGVFSVSVANFLVNINYLYYLGFRQRDCNGVGFGNILRRCLNQLVNVIFVGRIS